MFARHGIVNGVTCIVIENLSLVWSLSHGILSKQTSIHTNSFVITLILLLLDLFPLRETQRIVKA